MGRTNQSFSLSTVGGYNGNTVLNDFYQFKLKPIGIPPTALVSDFRKLINNPDMSDVRFLVEGKEVFAHKVILATRSEYFRVMLCGGMLESSGASTGDTVMQEGLASKPIELPGILYWVFLKVLEYLYTDYVRDTSLEVNIHLLIASEQFMLDRLKVLCEDLICDDISTDSVISILVASHRHNAAGLKNLALDYVLQHLDEQTIMSGLTELRSEPDLLLEIIRRNQLSNANGGGSADAASLDHLPIGPFGANNDWNNAR